MVFTFFNTPLKIQHQFFTLMSAQPNVTEETSFDLADMLEEPTPTPSELRIVSRPPKRSTPFRRGRNFVFTLNNPTEEEKFFWKSLLHIPDFRKEHHVRYIIFQTELGTNGTRHLQGYLELAKKMRPTEIKRRFGSRLHFENRRGTQAQAIAYAKKEDTRVPDGLAGDGGEAKKLGKDTVATVAAALKLGSDLMDLSEDYPVAFITHGARIREYALDQMGTRMSPPEVIIYYGKTGTGKSAQAAVNWPNAYWVPHPRQGGWWWPKYCGQETVIIDEFAGQFKYRTMLRLLDRYPFDIQEKGSNANFVSKRIVFTTNIHPNQWYPGVPYEKKAPLRRRFKDFCKIYSFADESTWDDPVFDEDVDTVDFST